MTIRRYIPILSWLPRYDRSWLPLDVVAGLTLWGLVVPEAMAYAGIAGLPPQAGLYTLVASLLIYALLGTSRHLMVGGTSASAALLASSVAAALVATAATTAVRPPGLRHVRRRLRAGHGPGVPAGGRRPAGLHHAVPVQARDGWLRDGPRGVRGRRPAQQAVRRGEAGWQHRGEAPGHHPGASRRRLDHVPGRGGCARDACSCCRGWTSGSRPGWWCCSGPSRSARSWGWRVVVSRWSARCRRGCRRSPCPPCRSRTTSRWCCRPSASCWSCSARRSGSPTSSPRSTATRSIPTRS